MCIAATLSRRRPAATRKEDKIKWLKKNLVFQKKNKKIGVDDATGDMKLENRTL